MRYRIAIASVIAAATLLVGTDLVACGDKFLVVGRGTRYQRPKGARAASVLFYTSPESGLTVLFKTMRVDSVLKREGHRATAVATLEQLSAALAGASFDVIFVDAADVPAVKGLLAGRPESPTLLPFCDGTRTTPVAAARDADFCMTSPPKERSILEAIDQAVDRRDRSLGKTAIRS